MLFLGICFLISAGQSLYSPSSNVVDLTESNFDKLVTQSDDVWIVEFYAPWCGHCQQFVGEYSKAGAALKVSFLVIFCGSY